jgi:hypothetical protein
MNGDLATACQPLALRTFRGKIRGRCVVGRLLSCFRLALLAARPVRKLRGVTARHPVTGMISGSDRRSESFVSSHGNFLNCVGVFQQSMGARNRVGTGLPRTRTP